MNPPETPECDKLSANMDWIKETISFFEWCEQKTMVSLRDAWGEDRGSPKKFIHQYLGIDDKKLEEERRALLEHQRQLNNHRARERYE